MAKDATKKWLVLLVVLVVLSLVVDFLFLNILYGFGSDKDGLKGRLAQIIGPYGPYSHGEDPHSICRATVTHGEEPGSCEAESYENWGACIEQTCVNRLNCMNDARNPIEIEGCWDRYWDGIRGEFGCGWELQQDLHSCEVFGEPMPEDPPGDHFYLTPYYNEYWGGNPPPPPEHN